MYFKNFPRVDYDLYGDGTTINIPNITSFASVRARKLLDEVAFYSYYDISDGDRPDNVSQKLYDTPKYYWTFFLINEGLVNYYDDWPKGNHYFKSWVESRYSTTCAITAPGYGSADIIHGKFKIGETVTGAISGATAKVIGKYPTDGYLEMEVETGTFLSQEGIYGLETQDYISTTSIVLKAYAPHHHIDVLSGETTIRRTAGTRPVSFYEWEQDQELMRSRIRVIKPSHIKKVTDEFVKEMSK